MRPIPLKILFSYLSQLVDSNELVHGAAIDSRLVKPGDLFFAIKGKKHDGHHSLEQVAGKHAVGAVVDQSYQGPSYGLELIRSNDVQWTLQEIAAQFLKRQSVKVIAITGSLGKTTTKEFAKTLIGSSFKLFASPLSYNSQLTVPLSILSARGDEEILILEMGMSEPGNLSRLIEIAPPDIALITTVSMQHADGFKEGLEGIAKEKAAIFSHPKTKIGIYPNEAPYASMIKNVGECEKKTFSTQNAQSDFFLIRDGANVTIHEKGMGSFSFSKMLPMNVYDGNLLAAISLARILEIPAPVISEIAPLVRVPPMRFEQTEKKGVVFINDAYNANPDAMVAAFESLPKPKQGGRKIGVISEMDALGEYTIEGHRIVAKAGLERLDCLFCIGDHCSIVHKVWKEKNKNCVLFPTVDSLKTHLKQFIRRGDVVLLKGARSYSLDRLLGVIE